VAAVVATGVLFAVVVGTARQDRLSTVERAAPPAMVVIGLAGCLAIVASAWLLWSRHPRACVGLSLLICGLALPTVAGWRSLPAWLRADALALGPLAIAGMALLRERWTPGRSGTLVLVAVFSLTAGAMAVHVIGYNPFHDPACIRSCVDTAPVARAFVSTHISVVVANLLTVVAGVVVAVAVSLQRSARPPGLITAGSVTALIVLVVASARQATTWGRRRPSDAVMLLPTTLVAASVGLTVLVVALRGRRTRVAIERLAARLAAPAASLFGGAVRAIHFAVPGDGRWIDASGGEVAVELDGHQVIVPDEAGPAVRFVVPRRTDAVELMAAFTPATRLALMNARLSAVARARLSDVTTSRRRVVATADAERRRIERDLHDGAQQRLVSASFHLSLARGRLTEVPPELMSAENHLRDALSHLRELAHGVFPSVIATEGLRPALEDLVRGADVAASLEMADECSVSVEVATAVYATVVAVLDFARSSNVTRACVSVHRESSTLIARVATGALIDADFTDAADRVGAVGGSLAVSTIDGETVVTAEFACA
jgi:signal transduction histidine kinase